MTEYIVVLVTAADRGEAKRIADGLLDGRLAACVSIVPLVESHYWWEGKKETAEEALLVIKSRPALLERIVACVKSLHGYTVPEVVALPILGGNEDYLAWLRTEAAGT